jgi:hypothetical protein
MGRSVSKAHFTHRGPRYVEAQTLAPPQSIFRNRIRLRLEALEDRLTPVNVNVVNLNDAGAGSLRDAMNQVIASNQVSTINISVNGTISIQSALPRLARAVEGAVYVTITGPGSANLTIERAVGATTNFRIFDIGSNSIDTITGVTISKGFFGGAGGVDVAGAGIYVSGRLTLSDSKVVDCQTTSMGGGIYVDTSARLTLSNVVVNGNKASGDGGGIYIARSWASVGTDTRILIQNNSQITSNTSLGGRGGGIYFGEPSISGTDRVNITGSSINQNTSQLAGGGLYFETVDSAGQMTATISSSNINENRALAGNGAAIYTGAKVTVDGTNFIGNVGGLFSGYTIAQDASVETKPLTFTNSWFQNNHYTPLGPGGGGEGPSREDSGTQGYAINSGTGTIGFTGCTIIDNDGDGVYGQVESGGGNTVTNSAATSFGWLPYPEDNVT